MTDEVALQRAYYASTAQRYDSAHGDENEEHSFALAYLAGMIPHIGASSLLDVGSGTGRVLRHFQKSGLRVVGIEPVRELREQGHRAGIDPECLLDGDGYNLQFPDASFDVVCEFGMLHHVKEPNRVVREMLRVAKRAVFISDCNNFGQGAPVLRTVKQLLHKAKLWPAADFIRTKGKGFQVSEGDGVFYSYSIFDSYQVLASGAQSVHIVNTTHGAGFDCYRDCSHGAILAIKK